MFLVQSALRATINRKLTNWGSAALNHNGRAIIVDKFVVKDLAGNVLDITYQGLPEGQSVIVEASTALSVSSDRVLAIKYHPEFYKAGLVAGPAFFDCDDKQDPIAFRLEVIQDGFNPTLLPYMAKLYVAES